MSEEYDPDKVCCGYLRASHEAKIILYRMCQDGKIEGLCEVCSTRWLLSDDEWGPPEKPEENKPWPEDKKPQILENTV